MDASGAPMRAGAGYLAAYTIVRGNVRRPSTRYRLKRIPVDEYITAERLAHRLTRTYDYAWRFHRLRRKVRRALAAPFAARSPVRAEHLPPPLQ